MHDDDEKCLTGAWTTVDITDAVDHGYILKKVLEIWDWGYAPLTTNLFHDFVNTVIKQKVESGGCESGVQEKVAREWYVNEGIDIDPRRLAQPKNDAMYMTAKLTANCLW